MYAGKTCLTVKLPLLEVDFSSTLPLLYLRIYENLQDNGVYNCSV